MKKQDPRALLNELIKGAESGCCRVFQLAQGLMGRRKFVIAGDPGDTPVFQMDFSDPTSAIDTLLTD